MMMTNVLTLLVTVNVVYATTKRLTCDDIKVPTIFFGSRNRYWWQLSIAGPRSLMKQTNGLAPIDTRLGGSDMGFIQRIVGQTDNLLFAIGQNFRENDLVLMIYDLKAGLQIMERRLRPTCSPFSMTDPDFGVAVVRNKLLLICHTTDVHVFTVISVGSGAYIVEETTIGARQTEKVYNVLLRTSSGEACLTVNVSIANCFNPTVNQWHLRGSVPTLEVSSKDQAKELVTINHNGKIYRNTQSWRKKQEGWTIYKLAMNLHRNKVYVPYYRVNKENKTELNIVDLVANKSMHIFELPHNINIRMFITSYIFIKPCTDVDVISGIAEFGTNKIVAICLAIILIVLVIVVGGIWAKRRQARIKNRTKPENATQAELNTGLPGVDSRFSYDTLPRKPSEVAKLSPSVYYPLQTLKNVEDLQKKRSERLDLENEFDSTMYKDVNDTKGTTSPSSTDASIFRESSSNVIRTIGRSKGQETPSSTDVLSVFNTNNTNKSKENKMRMPSGLYRGTSNPAVAAATEDLVTPRFGDREIGVQPRQRNSVALSNNPRYMKNQDQKALDMTDSGASLSKLSSGSIRKTHLTKTRRLRSENANIR